MNNLIEELILEFLNYSYPIIRIRLPNIRERNGGLKTNINFKRTIRINTEKIFIMSDINDTQLALYALSDIVCHTFNITQDESLPIIKTHLRIK